MNSQMVLNGIYSVISYNFDPAFKVDGQSLTEGFIALQSESHPVEFRKVELMNLKGCKDPKAKNYKTYYVKEDNSLCRY